MKRTRFHLAHALFLLLGIIAVGAPTLAGSSMQGNPSPDQAVDDERLAKVKGAYLLNFIKFTNWPANAFTSELSPITVTIVGKDPLGLIADATFRDKKIHGRSVTIARIDVPDNLAEAPVDDVDPLVSAFLDTLNRSHLIYLAPMLPEETQHVLAHLSGSNALLVGDTMEQAKSGCHLGFMIEKRRLVFCANHEVIDKSPLKLSSKLLQLARPIPDS